MKDYFSHDYNARNDKKIVKAFMKFGLSAIGAYWCIVEMLYEEGGYLPLSEYERITFELRTQENIIDYLINDSELFLNDGIKFWSESAIERLKLRSEKSQKAKESVSKRWNKYDIDTNVLQSNNESNTIKESKVKENKEKRTNKFVPPTVDDCVLYFDTNGYSETSAKKFFEYYNCAEWKDSKGNQVKSWKQKAQAVWFKTENEKNTFFDFKPIQQQSTGSIKLTYK